MYKLDPIERLPDGSLFRLTPGQLRSAVSYTHLTLPTTPYV